MKERVVLAYSGGLDTSAIVPWLVETMDAEVVAFVADVGQGAEELEGVEEKAKASGAVDCHIVDLKQTFVEEFVWPTLAAGAIYEGRYLLGTSMARPPIARAQVEVARKVGATAVAHGCTGKGNDQVRFEAAFGALAPDLKIIAPWREWSMRSRQQLLDYLSERNIPCSSSLTKIYSRDRNLWHISHEGGAIEDPWAAPPEDAWMMSVSPLEAPDTPEEVIISYERGRPISVNGERLRGDLLIERLNTIAGKHGVGRIDLVENRCVGMKSRGLYETPGGTVLMEGLAGLAEVCLDRDTHAFRSELALRFAKLVYDGRWFTFYRESIAASIERIAERLTGEVAVQLYKGSATTTRRRSPFSLYSEDFATFGEDEVYNQQHAEGFIRLFTLPERIAGLHGLQSDAAKSPGQIDEPGYAPVVGPRTAPPEAPSEEPVKDPIIKEGNVL